MGWREFCGYVDAMYKQLKGETADDPYSWRGTENDPWWQAVRAKRADELRRRF